MNEDLAVLVDEESQALAADDRCSLIIVTMVSSEKSLPATP